MLEDRAEIMTSDEYYEDNFKEVNRTDDSFNEFWEKVITELLEGQCQKNDMQ